MDDEPKCFACNHALDEHKPGFFAPCTVEGCDCLDFTPIEDEPLDTSR